MKRQEWELIHELCERYLEDNEFEDQEGNIYSQLESAKRISIAYLSGKALRMINLKVDLVEPNQDKEKV